MTRRSNGVQAPGDDFGTATGDVVTLPTVFRNVPADPVLERSRSVWGAGAYDRIAAGFRNEAELFVHRRALHRDDRVLDLACGTGNATIPAARTGAKVTGLDLVPALLAAAGARAEAANVKIVLDEGNAEQLPYGDAEFDTVLSMFGVMFAARPDRAIAELTRVTRRGGQVVLANWVRHGFVGEMLRMHTAMVPPPAGASSPLLWGDEGWLRENFTESAWRVEIVPRVLAFQYPLTPAGTAELFRGSYGPSVRTFEVLAEDDRARLIAQLAAHWATHNRGGPSATIVDSDYIEVIATRR